MLELKLKQISDKAQTSIKRGIRNMKLSQLRYLVAAVALVIATSTGLASTAAADPSTATIDPNATTTLVFHKYSGPVNATEACNPNNGSEVSADCLTQKTPLKGATFTVYKVRDLKTNNDWSEALKITSRGVAAYSPIAEGVAVTTGENGTATFTGTVALYYVVETATPTGYTGSQPFFVTLPMTNADNNGWNYNVHVYPKNDEVIKGHKSVKDGNVGTENQAPVLVGDKVTYVISAALPNYGDVVGPVSDGVHGGPDGVVDYNDLPFFYVDDYFVDTLTEVTVASVKIGATALVENTDYAVYTNGSTKRVFLLEAGRTKAAQSNGGKLEVTFTAKVNGIPTSGELSNKAYTVPGPKPVVGSVPPAPNTPDTPPTTPPGDNPGEETNTVVSKFGKIKVKKLGADNNAALRDAQFSIYRAVITYGDNGKTVAKASCAAADLAGKPVVGTLTTDAQGVATSNFLPLSNWYNDGVELAPENTAVDKLNDKHFNGAGYAETYGNLPYCLVETTAPAGYQLLAEPIQFEITTAGEATDAIAELVVKNNPDNLLTRLPLTGGAGIALLAVVGILIFASGVGYYRFSQRRDAQA